MKDKYGKLLKVGDHVWYGCRRGDYGRLFRREILDIIEATETQTGGLKVQGHPAWPDNQYWIDKPTRPAIIRPAEVAFAWRPPEEPDDDLNAMDGSLMR